MAAVSSCLSILEGTATWLFEHFVHRRAGLKKISAESLRKLLAGKSPRGAAVAEIGQPVPMNQSGEIGSRPT